VTSIREAHLSAKPGNILIAPDAANAQQGISQVLSLTVARIGPLMIVAGPAEFTTMSGRRIRDTVRSVMGDDLRDVVVAGYSNGYAGYVTTKEEYDTQQYEGSHTLFGPWTLAAYQQEYARLAQALRDDQRVDSPVVSPVDLRGKVKSTALGTDAEVSPKSGKFGDQITPPAASYNRGDTALAIFWTTNPQNSYPSGVRLLSVQHQRLGKWVTVANDSDWSTKCLFSPGSNVSKPYQVETTWTIPAHAAFGTYRLLHVGQVNKSNGGVHGIFEGMSDSFEVTE
jgi:neutral ceramidase